MTCLLYFSVSRFLKWINCFAKKSFNWSGLGDAMVQDVSAKPETELDSYLLSSIKEQESRFD